MNNSLNILLCAYACEPNKGSEPGVGWDTATTLAISDVKSNYFVITRKNNRESIEKEVIPKNLQFIYYDLPFIFLFIKRKISFVRIYYYLWMLGAVVKLWQKRKTFQIIHHITFVNDWFPSLFILLKNNNNFFIWGPIGSNHSIDDKFLYSIEDRRAEKRKTIFLKIIRKVDVFFWLCKSKSDVIIGTHSNVKNIIKLREKHLFKFIDMPAIAIRQNTLIEGEKKDFDLDQFIIISAGQLRYIKNFRLTIKAFSLFLKLVPHNEKGIIKLQIVGAGNQKDELINYVNELKIKENVDFTGQINQQKLMKYFREAQLFLFPTLENAGFVILEAMSNFLPIVALDYGGPKQFVKKNRKNQLVSSEIRIEEIENQLSNRILQFYKDPKLRKEVGLSNYNTIVENFTFKKKADKFIYLYKELLNEREANEE